VISANSVEDRYLTIDELVDYSRLSRRTIMRHIRSETSPLPHYRVGGRVLVKRGEFDTWLAKVGTPDNVARARAVDDKVRDALDHFGRR
jgi:excisionase family DNA binding protein